MSERISISEFARRAGCNEKQVRRAIEGQRLAKGKDGKLNASDVAGVWRKPNRRTMLKRVGEATPAPVRTTQNVRATIIPEGERAAPPPKRARTRPSDDAGPTSFDRALQLKETYLGRLKQLEYDQKAGRVVVAEDVAKAVGAEYARVRTRLLSIPAERAPEIHRQRSVREVEALLRSVIVEALGELTLDGAPST